MNVKKGLILTSASFLLTMGTAYAGGPDTTVTVQPCGACIPAFMPVAYVGLSAGWAYSDWNSFILSGLPSKADTNGFAYGGKVGLQVFDHFGIEGGIFSLPDSDQTIDGVSGTVQSWFAYGAATVRAALPFNPFVHIMGKLGGAYRALDHEGDLYSHVGNGEYGTIMLGASIDYDLVLTHLPLSVGVDYYYIPGTNDSWLASNPVGINKDAAPAAQVVVGSISARFVI